MEAVLEFYGSKTERILKLRISPLTFNRPGGGGGREGQKVRKGMLILSLGEIPVKFS